MLLLSRKYLFILFYPSPAVHFWSAAAESHALPIGVLKPVADGNSIQGARSPTRRNAASVFMVCCRISCVTNVVQGRYLSRCMRRVELGDYIFSHPHTSSQLHCQFSQNVNNCSRNRWHVWLRWKHIPYPGVVESMFPSKHFCEPSLNYSSNLHEGCSPTSRNLNESESYLVMDMGLPIRLPI